MKTSAREWWTAVILALVLLALCVGVALVLKTPPLRPSPEPRPERSSAGEWVEVSRGHYLVRAGDCKACHTAAGGAPFAGGRAIPTPFGTIYSTNITPDAATGIGHWSFDDFYRAMHHGLRRDGSRLYPAFPYPWYTRVSRADVFAIKAYLDTLAPVQRRAPPNELPWPLSVRAVMAGWNALFFDAGNYVPRSDESAQWNRGAYLVQGLLHCGACHTEKNFAGADKTGHELQGGLAEHAWAPNLHGAWRDGLGAWSAAEIAEYLKTGSNDKSAAAGPMAEVVQRSTQYLSDADLAAIAIYLKTLPGDDETRATQHPAAAAGTASAPPSVAAGTPSTEPTMQRGRTLYVDNCEGCHMQSGRGLQHVFPPLGGSASIMAERADTLILVLLQGAQTPPTASKPTGVQMPAFERKLSDAQIADVLSYIRNAWGNQASDVSARQVADARQRLRQTP